jgi:hypothetical protein
MTTDEVIQRSFTFRGRNQALPWYPRRGDRNGLANVFAKLEFQEGVEIGTQRGQFAAILCTANPKLHLTCVDPWLGYIEQPNGEKMAAYYEEALKALSPFNVTIMRKGSMEAVPEIPDRSLDFVYVDGNHQFDPVMLDLIHWAPKVRPGGIVAGHDYHPFHGPGVMTAVNAYTHCHDIRPWYVTSELWPTYFWVSR